MSARAKWEQSSLLVRSIVLGMATAALGMVFVWASLNVESESWQSFWANIGTAVFTTGVLGICYEGFLKRGLIWDFEQRIGIHSELSASGVARVTQDLNQLSLGELFADSDELEILPYAPLIWHDSNMSWLVEIARKRKMTCRLYLPDPVEYSRMVRSLDGDSSSYGDASQCEAKMREYGKTWDAEGLTGNKSTLETLVYSGYPHQGFILGRNAAVLFTSDPKVGLPTFRGMAVVYKGERGAETYAWVRESIRRLNATAIDGSVRDLRTPEEILPPIDPNSGKGVAHINKKDGGSS
jgi:hypothetical protein